MKIKGISIPELTIAMSYVSVRKYEDNITFNRKPERKGNWLHFTLTVEDTSGPGARRSHQGRKVKAACWHAHRDIMEEIFDIAPGAVLVAAMARYEGREGFARTYPATGETNIGSMIEPMRYRDACECEE